jgi:hypothetical protein
MRKVASVFAVILLAAAGLYAHHGWTGYDESKTVQHTGVIKEAGYENPHGYVDLQVNKQVWRVVLAPPARMESRGLAKDKLKVGSTATIVGYQHKDTKNEIRAERITIDGKTIELR